jgi:ABC-type xylose transport system substrate-binding protein
MEFLTESDLNKVLIKMKVPKKKKVKWIGDDDKTEFYHTDYNLKSPIVIETDNGEIKTIRNIYTQGGKKPMVWTLHALDGTLVEDIKNWWFKEDYDKKYNGKR